MYNLLYLGVGMVSGYLATRWIPNFSTRNMSQFFTDIIFDPVLFSIGMISFFVSFLTLSQSVKFLIESTYAFIHRKRSSLMGWPINLICLFYFYFLAKVDLFTVIVLAFFTVIYGIISVDLKKQDDVEYEHNH